MEDKQIIDLFFARNEDAIQHTADTYGNRLFVLADNIVRNDQDAEESVSDTYLKAWDTIPPQKPNHFFAYLAKICRHFALGKLDWKNAAKRKAEVVSLTQEMELCIPDDRRNADLEGTGQNPFRVPADPDPGKSDGICAPLLVCRHGGRHCSPIWHQ